MKSFLFALCVVVVCLVAAPSEVQAGCSGGVCSVAPVRRVAGAVRGVQPLKRARGVLSRVLFWR